MKKWMKLAGLLLCLALCAGLLLTGALAAGEKNGWVEENGEWFYYQDGDMQIGWLYDGGKWYFLNDTYFNGASRGAMLTYAWDIGDSTYFFDPVTGAMQVGWVYAPTYGTWFYADWDGSGHDGWLYDGGKWYFLEDGWLWTDVILEIGDRYYSFGPDGAMETGWVACDPDDGTGRIDWYYFDPSGVSHEGWLYDGGHWYYCKNGLMAQGFEVIDGKRYWFYDSGVMATGWAWVSWPNGYTGWAYFDADGAGHNGWVQSGSDWYYCEDCDPILDGGYDIDGLNYFFNESGVMQTGWVKFGDNSNEWTYFDEDGAGHVGWLKSNGYWYYFPESGSFVYGGFWYVDDVYYVFDYSGHLVS